MTHSPLLDIRSIGWSDDVASHRAVPVVLHGFGSSEQNLAGLVPALGLGLPWASLRAPLDLGNGGAAWFEISTPGDPAAGPVVEATDAIWAWIDENLDPSTLVIPIGFSQGGLMASQLMRTRPERVLATVVLGGFVLGAPQPGDDTITASRPPVFWGRGAEDRVIGIPAIDRTSGFLPHHSTLTERVYPGLAHGISQSEIVDVSAFVAAQLAGAR